MKKRTLLICSLFLFLLLIIFNIFKSRNNLNDTLYVSFGSSDIKAKIINTKLSEEQIIKEYSDYDYVKIDKLVDIENLSYAEFKKKINNDEIFSYGIALDNNRIVLLSEELNSNSIINRKEHDINFDNLNKYLSEKGIKTKINNLSRITIFKTESKYLNNNVFINLENKVGFNNRNITEIKNELPIIIKNTGQLLASMNENGKYIYGYKSNLASKINSYNILRHAGSTWSLILYYEKYPSIELRQTIEAAIEYLIDNFTVEYNDDIAFVVEKKAAEIKLGGNALTLLMLAEYKLVFSDSKYDDISKKIAEGIMYMQNEDGSFNHILDLNFNVEEKFRTVYYDGEATFSLLKYYKTNKDEYLLNQVKKSIDYFIDKNYEQYRDQWISYTLNEYVKINSDEKYILFALLNYTYNKQKLDNNRTFGPTRLELLMTTLDTYNYATENIDSFNINDFNLKELKNSIEINFETLFNFYISEEVAMYLNNPILVLNGFHDIKSSFRMRIDDLQHSLLGIMKYNDLYND